MYFYILKYLSYGKSVRNGFRGANPEEKYIYAAGYERCL